MSTLKNTVTGSKQIAIIGSSKHYHGVIGESEENGTGVLGVSSTGEGVSGFSKTGQGVVGQSEGSSGVRGLSKSGRAVEGMSEIGDALVGVTDSGAGVTGNSSTGPGIVGLSESASGVRGTSKSGRGVEGWSESTYGVSGESARSAGVRGTSEEGRGVEGWSQRSEGVFGICEIGTGVLGVSGRSSFRSKFGVHSEAEAGIFRIGGAAKQWAESSTKIMVQEQGSHEADEMPASKMLSTDPKSLQSNHPSDEKDIIQSIEKDSIGSAEIDKGLSVRDDFYDSMGIGVCGEHRRGGIGVKAVSRSGMGLAAYSEQHEGVHAETHSGDTAAIAAYNLNPRGTGAAVFAKKEGTRGHAGFFDGKVWISGELGVGGDIVLANADCAEEFDVIKGVVALPGTVMVAGAEGALHPSDQAYDKRVVGVISGGGYYKPGLVLDKQAASENRYPIALLGKVFCNTTADFGQIEVGDLLTTSPISGYAMRASDSTKAFGAVIGKALSPLREGQGLIPILIALQ